MMLALPGLLPVNQPGLASRRATQRFTGLGPCADTLGEMRGLHQHTEWTTAAKRSLASLARFSSAWV
jgi:hypothetical protein